MATRAAFVVALILRSIYGGMNIVAKGAFDEGMSTSVFVLYRHAIAIPFLLPIAYMLERKTSPALTFKASLKLFVHALYGISGSINVYSIGLSYASATSSSAISNVLPVVAFFLAVLLRQGIESLNMKRFQGIVKVTGIVFCFAGVIVLAFYQGPEMKSFNHHRLLHQTSNSHATVIVHSVRTWLLGIFLMTLGTICWAFWTVLQGPILDAYPSKLLNTSLQIVFATIQSFFIALVVERDFSRWKLKLDISLIAVLYCVSSICVFLMCRPVS
uniref:WAT1-related protein n=1 Tax=Setaria italica TaxID=4555 RepID=K3XRW6_SETIT